MKIICLIENETVNPLCKSEHGLSIYIETEKHRLLCDAGQSENVIKNAEILGVDLSGIDSIFLSHGHYDHSGGIEKIAALNKNLKIYLHKNALLPHYHFEKYIGVSKNIAELDNLIFSEKEFKIDDELFLFSGIKGRRFFPHGNRELSQEINGEKVQDDFSHEQCIVISESGKNILVSGCAHNGILNILDRYSEIFGGDPDIVISGFHFKKSTEYTAADIEIITETAHELNRKNTVFYTGHCTGQAAFDIMKNIMGDKLNVIHSGQKIIEI